jgi:hypothetical protein
MRLVDRAKNICLTPRTEWEVIAGEATPIQQIITTYVLPLAAVAAVAHFIGICLIGVSMGFFGGTFRMPITWGLVSLVYHLVMSVVTVLVLGLIIDALAPTFGAQKGLNQAVKVAAYAYTPAWIASILLIIPMLGILVLLAGLYGIYLMYLGLPRVMKNPEDKAAGYTAVVVIAAIVIGVIVSVVGGMLMAPAMIATAGFEQRHARVDPASPLGKLDDFSRRMEEQGKKMEAAEKSGDARKMQEAALATLGTALSGGKGVEPLQLDQIKPYMPETFAGLPRTNTRSERSGVQGLMVAKVENQYGNGADKRVELEVVDTGGMAGIMGLAGWVGLQGEREDDNRMERTRKEGTRMVHEEVSKKGGTNKYAVVLGDRFVVSASGNGVNLDTLKSGVAALDLAGLEATK